MIASLNKISCDFYRHGVFLSFSGPMSQDLMVEMGRILKTKMKLEGASTTTILKVFSILIELNQNIIHYSAERMTLSNQLETSEKTGCGLMAVGKERETYFLISGNVIEANKADALKSRLSALKEMNSEELKATYREMRKSKPGEDSKGAGLGFIEVARKASQPLEFNFEPIDTKLSFFSLKTTI